MKQPEPNTTIEPEVAALQDAQLLWKQGNFAQAQGLVRKAMERGAPSARLKFAAWAYDDAFVSPLAGRRVTLVRRSPGDLAFLRAAWMDREFMTRFHRLAPQLPVSDGALRAILAKEQRATLLDSNQLHWTVLTAPQKVPIGIVSLVEMSLSHRRAELIVGVRGAAPGTALEATLLALEFAFRTVRLHKVVSTIYGGNDYAFRSTAHLGFELEGRLRQHIQDPVTHEYVDLCMLGLFSQHFYSPANQRLAKRLLRRPLLI